MKWAGYWTSAILILIAGLLYVFQCWYEQEELYSTKIAEIQKLESYIDVKREVESKVLWLCAPVDDMKITSSCGIRENPMGGGEEGLHRGTDMVGPLKGFIYAAADGVVVDHWPPPDRWYSGHPVFGGMVTIDHGGGIFTLYGHMRATLVKRGDTVTRGQKIGRQGNTGISDGEHLHFEVIVDPEIVLSGIIPRAVLEW